MPGPSAPRPPRAALPRRPCPGPGARTLAVLLLAALLIGLAPSGPARAEGPRWRWPLPPPHTVLSPFEAPEHRYGPGHRGIDIAVPAEGAQVRAVEAGAVRFSGAVAGRGVVSVVHADGLISTYEPVDGLLEVGSRVEQGEVLGTLESGSAASHCPGGCLHLGARRGGDYLDPLPLLGAHAPSVLLPWAGPSRDGGPPAAAGSGAFARSGRLPATAARAMGAGLAGIAAADSPGGASASGT